MLEFISENLGSIIIGAIVLAILVLIIAKMVHNRKISGCSCGDCSGCGSRGVCAMRDKIQEETSATDKDELNRSDK